MGDNEEPILNAINRACGELPDGYIISLMMENGSGWVAVTNPAGEDVDFDSTDMSLVEQIEYCIDEIKIQGFA